ncbi:UPF0061-domain-containing protein [Eremomyces bilateralis CBS 781.70]|uniref:Selenoprotein O n=1 Tax=Eremomyces bilateralis CBS 781.70 TaxID=1392243 RepID=A0A6G1FZ23_9PEZI|nr:UPF0061-domain-containing protein [Eremomyces bilateralis CBS 781.70]KAF1810930.1 UPF0061-domain-containing protein [Eremomyces bilateralis CBS 781.70]
MAAHLNSGSGDAAAAAAAAQDGVPNSPAGYTLRDLPKSSVFTSALPADPDFPTPQSSHSAPRSNLGPRLVKGAFYTFVRPEGVESPELLGVSKAALRDIGIAESEVDNPEFQEAVAGNKTLTWDEEKQEGIYPWAQCYGGYQFGQWAGQLGDGRAISLFESTNPQTGKRYEIQLKGAGRTPYSRFADGKAVLRSSIREYVISEYLNAIGIRTTRALSLTLAPNSKVLRERLEPGAIVCRFAESWVRIGTFDLQRARGDRDMVRKLADYVAENNFGGWDKLPGTVAGTTKAEDFETPRTGLGKDEIEGEGVKAQNRYVRLYRQIARANARSVAAWQAYGFMNGVLNTDNTSIIGLSMDYGPFAFLDSFDPSYTPNHDDYMLRYSYKNQPTIIWWNLLRLGESLGELLGAGANVDHTEFVEAGVRKEDADELIKRAEEAIEKTGEEYKTLFIEEYKRLMAARFGLKQLNGTLSPEAGKSEGGDFDSIVSEALDTMEAHELDFNHFFRRLSDLKTTELETEEQRKDIAGRFFSSNGIGGDESEARQRLSNWLDKWRARVVEDWADLADSDRIRAMKSANPNFVPRSWILDEIIERVEKKGDRDILPGVMELVLNPFADTWNWNEKDEGRFVGDVPKYKSMLQCSCSS